MAASSDEDGAERGGERALKIALLGDSAVGKTAICCRLAQHSFPQKYIQTAGVDFYSRRVNLPQSTSVLLQLWDIGGNNLASHSMLNTYIFGAQAVIFVYDVTSSQSFENLVDWVSIARKMANQLQKPFYMGLIGNKADNEHRRVIRVEKHSKFADQNAMQSHFYVSAKTGDSIELSFKKIAAEILGVHFSRAEKEWDINVVQTQIQAADKSRALGIGKKQNEHPRKNGSGEESKEEVEANEPLRRAERPRNSAMCSMQ